MKEKTQNQWIQKQTDPFLLKAHHELSDFVKATGAIVCITDQNNLSIPEMFDEVTVTRNTCLYCLKCRSNMTISKNQDYLYHPCRELHMNAIKKASMAGSSHQYMCDLGFMFWATPIYSDQNFLGTMIGGGFLGVDKQETAEKMEMLGKGTEDKKNIQKHLMTFSHADESRIKSLSELMMVCLESLSRGKGSSYKTFKRRAMQQNELREAMEKIREGFSDGIQPEYPLEMEKIFLDTVQKGDAAESRRLLNELLGYLLLIYPGQFQNLQFRILELAILLSRIENACGNMHNSFSLATQKYLKSMEKAEKEDELIDSIHQMTQYLANDVFTFQGIRHVSALKKADRYIQMNFTQKISLNEIAEASGLSAPYFSTIFKKEMGENLASYLNRLRVEKASHLLTESDLSINDIAYSCGFEDQSWFSKIFKSYTGLNPRKYRTNMKIPQN